MLVSDVRAAGDQFGGLARRLDLDFTSDTYLGDRLDIIVMQQFAYTRYIFLLFVFMFVPNSYLLNILTTQRTKNCKIFYESVIGMLKPSNFIRF